MKKLISLILILSLCFVVCNAEYKDVINDAYGMGSEADFDDIGSVPWAEDAIRYFTQNGIIKHNFEKKLYPDKHITREEFVDVLISAFGLYDTTAQCDFNDIDKEYYGCIATANKLGIVKGMSETEFGFGREITRQDLCTMSYRVTEYLGNDFTGNGEITFFDADKISDYALPSVTKLTQVGIINGYDTGNFEPFNFTTRAEAYKIIYLLMLKNA